MPLEITEKIFLLEKKNEQILQILFLIWTEQAKEQYVGRKCYLGVWLD